MYFCLAVILGPSLGLLEALQHFSFLSIHLLGTLWVAPLKYKFFKVISVVKLECSYRVRPMPEEYQLDYCDTCILNSHLY